MSWLRRLVAGPLPADFPGELAEGEYALASATVATGGHLVVTRLGLWVPDGDAARRIGWHLVSKATWAQTMLTVIEAEESEHAGEAVLLVDHPPVPFELPKPGKLPHLVRERVEGSIRSRYRKEIDGGGAWFVERKIPGHDGTILQVRADPGADSATVSAIAREAAGKLRNSGR